MNLYLCNCDSLFIELYYRQSEPLREWLPVKVWYPSS